MSQLYREKPRVPIWTAVNLPGEEQFDREPVEFSSRIGEQIQWDHGRNYTKNPSTDVIDYSDQFVNERPELSTGHASDDHSPFTIASGNQLDHSTAGEPSTITDGAPGQVIEGEKPDRNIETADVDTWMADRDLDPSGYSQTSFNDESAARGLLALGTASPERFLDILDFSDAHQSLDEKDAGIGSNYQHSPNTALPKPELHFSKCGDVSAQSLVLQLLRQYRYEVAPWVCGYSMNLVVLLTDITGS